MHDWGFGMGLGWIVPLLFVFALFYLIRSGSGDKESPREILDRRYANGEIDEEEYKRKKEQLTH